LKKTSIKSYFFERTAGGPKSSTFYPTINPFISNKGMKSNNSIILCENDKIVNDPKEMTEIFNNFLQDMLLASSFLLVYVYQLFLLKMFQTLSMPYLHHHLQFENVILIGDLKFNVLVEDKGTPLTTMCDIFDYTNLVKTATCHTRNRLLDQGYKKIRLIRSLKKFIFRYQYLVEIYSVSAEKIISNAFS
jgi:hypothetical protein